MWLQLVGTVALAALLAAAPLAAQQAAFIPLGDLPGGGFESEASGISADGTVVVGTSSSATQPEAEAFRWTYAGGMTGLGTPVAGGASRASSASSDGAVIVGEASPPENLLETRPFRWTTAGGMLPLGTTDGVTHAISGDASTVVGLLARFGGFVWTQASGFQASGISEPWAVSHDGTVVVGGEPATRCDTAGCMGLTLGATRSAAFAVSSDGSTVVGTLSTAPGGGAFRWTQAEGAVPLDASVPSTFQYSVARGVSGDGLVVVGERDYGVPVWWDGSSVEAFLWTPASGMRDLRDIFVFDYKLDLQGFILREAVAVSADGRAIVGNGINQFGEREAWIAVFPQPIAPSPDSDGDGVPDSRDNCPAAANAIQADTDRDGVGDACNDADDADQDEWSDALDNCANASNPAQEDDDGDGQGDACDPFPSEPDNAWAQCFVDLGATNVSLYEALVGVGQTQASVSACQAQRFFADSDGDGEDDTTDRCPGSSAEPVDGDGCTRTQFCAAHAATCKKNDWMNDEPGVKKPRDCSWDKRARSCT